jgi:hypothetical protein
MFCFIKIFRALWDLEDFWREIKLTGGKMLYTNPERDYNERSGFYQFESGIEEIEIPDRDNQIENPATPNNSHSKLEKAVVEE